MATFTAQFLIGSQHPYGGGIIPKFRMYFSENDRPAWVIRREEGGRPLTIWIPWKDRTIEDAFLIISLYVLRDEEILKRFENILDKKLPIDLNWEFDKEELKELYEINREVLKKHGGFKVVISVLESSHIEKQLPVVKDYEIGLEVCKSVYGTFSNPFTGKRGIRGSLEFKEKNDK